MKMRLLPILFSLLLVTTSCEEWLEEQTLSNITESNFYKTDRDLSEAGIALYATMAVAHQYNYATLGDLAADGVVAGNAADAEHKNFDQYTFDRNSSVIYLYWRFSYRVINYANLLIAKAPVASLASEEAKTRALAEAYFFRAYSYYVLTRMFKDVPLIETFPAPQLPFRTPQAEVYAAIVRDLKMAIGETDPNVILPSTNAANDNGRALIGSGYALLAEVYLTLQDYPNAALYAKKVIDLNEYALWPVWGSQYLYPNKYAPNSKRLGESVFAFQYDQDAGVPNRIVRDCAPAGVRVGFNAQRTGFEYFVARQETLDRFEPNDARKAYIFPPTYPDRNNVQQPWNAPGSSQFFMYKYRLADQPGTPYFGNTAHNWDILRYADVLLIYAEALNEVSGPGAEALSALNEVRTRANLPALEGLSQESFRAAVEQERFAEFFLEGHRLWDLKRTGKWYTVMSAIIPNLDPNKEYFPIPQTERDANVNLTQNPGW